MADIKHVKAQYDGIKNGPARGNLNSYWQEVAEYVMPTHADFWQKAHTSSKGEKKNTKIYDATAVISLGHFASLLESLVTPRHMKWHGLATTDPLLNTRRENREWLEQARDILFAYRYRSSAGFTTQMAEAYMSIGAFGNGSLFIDRTPRGLGYKATFIGDTFFGLDQYGRLDTVFYRFDFTHHQANQRWGEQLPREVLTEVERNPFESSSYVHAVKYDEGLPNGLRYRSYYFHEQTGTPLRDNPDLKVEGYRVMPYVVGRYRTSPHEVMGRGPAMEVLPDIRTLNEMAWADLRATHKLVDPVLLAHDDGLLGMGRSEINLDPGGVNFGGVSADGRQLIQPLQTGARVDLNEAKMDVKRQVIREAFMVNLFQILTETPRMTATEVLQRSQEKGSLMGPIMGRIQTEMIGPKVERELDILLDLGVIPPPPPDLAEALAAEEIQIIFDSPLTRLQRMEELAGIDIVIQQALQLANAGDRRGILSLDGFNIMKHTSLGSGAPADVVRDQQAVEADLRAEQENAAAAQQLEMAKAGAQQATGIKNLAQAEALRRGG